MFLFILTALLLANPSDPPQSFARGSSSECRYVNLTEKGQVFHGIPSLDQQGSQICYAYSGAQLIEGQRVLQGAAFHPNDSVNPVSLALNLAIATGHTDLQQGAVACDAVNLARTMPVCPANRGFHSTNEIETIVSELHACRKSRRPGACDRLADRHSVNRALARQGDPLRFVKAIEDRRCPADTRIRLAIPPCERENDESRPSSDFKRFADRVFDSESPRPVEIGYSMHLLSYRGNEKQLYRIRRVSEPDGVAFSLRYKPHSSILLGRRMAATGQCQYLLRSSQGRDFCPSGIAARLGWECDPVSEGIWINETELFDSVFQVSSIRASAPRPVQAK